MHSRNQLWGICHIRTTAQPWLYSMFYQHVHLFGILSADVTHAVYSGIRCGIGGTPHWVLYFSTEDRGLFRRGAVCVFSFNRQNLILHIFVVTFKNVLPPLYSIRFYTFLSLVNKSFSWYTKLIIDAKFVCKQALFAKSAC